MTKVIRNDPAYRHLEDLLCSWYGMTREWIYSAMGPLTSNTHFHTRRHLSIYITISISMNCLYMTPCPELMAHPRPKVSLRCYYMMWPITWHYPLAKGFASNKTRVSRSYAWGWDVNHDIHWMTTSRFITGDEREIWLVWKWESRECWWNEIGKTGEPQACAPPPPGLELSNEVIVSQRATDQGAGRAN